MVQNKTPVTNGSNKKVSTIHTEFQQLIDILS